MFKKILSRPHIFFKLSFFARTIKPKLTTTPIPQPPKPLETQIIKSQKEEKEVVLSKRLKRNNAIRKLALQELHDEKFPRPEKNFFFLPQTQSFDEIVAYVQKFKKILKEPQYLIIMSRIAHLKNVKEHNLDPRLFEIIRKVCTLRLRKNPKFISNFIKYAAMIGIHDKMFWRRLISELYKTDFKQSLTEFCLTLNYLQVHGVLSKTLLDHLQEKAVDLLEKNVDNQSFKIMELLLNSLKNFKTNPELLKAVLKRLRLHVHTMPLKNLRNSFIPAVQMRLEDEELWGFFRKWIFLRMEQAKKNGSWEEIRENYSYLVFTYAKIGDEGMIKDFKEQFNGEEYKDLRNSLYSIFSTDKENLFYKNNAAHFIRIFKAFSLFSVNYNRPEDSQNTEFLINYLLANEDLQKNMKIKDFFEIFTTLTRINDLYKPFEKHQRLLTLINFHLVAKSFELPILAFKKMIDFFIDEKNKAFVNEKEIMEDILSKIKENFASIVGLRGVHNDQDRVTAEMILERLNKEKIIEKESFDLIEKGIKKQNLA